MNTLIKIVSLILFISIFFSYVSYVSAAGTHWNIMTFGTGNTDAWKKEVGLRDVRACCSSNPETCLRQRLDPTTGSLIKYDKLFLCLGWEASTAATYALRYSELSTSYPKLEEIGFDDFFTYWNTILKRDQAALSKILDNTKKINPNLKFGITLYENQIPFLKEGTAYHLNDYNSKKIDYVHLYLHHRKTSTEKMTTDVAAVKTLFPHAKIIAGSYAFDYKSPCTDSPSDTLPCTGKKELDYFKESLQIQATLMKNGLFEAIEFWQAFFGNEERINYIRCLDKRKLLFNEEKEIALPKCIANTKVMRAEVLKILNATKPSPTPTKKPTITPSPTGKKGDLDKDGDVDINDYDILLANFGKTNAAYNLTGDNTIDIYDYNMFVSLFGK